MTMNINIKRLISILLGIAFLGILGFGTYLLLKGIIRALTTLNSDVAVAIIAAAATALISVLTIILGRIIESRSLLEREHREKKIPVYEELIAFMFRILMGSKTGSQPTEKEILQFMSGFTQRIAIWGSDDVLASWVKFRRLSVNEAELKANPVALMILYEQLIMTIRHDLGHKNKNLETGSILSLFLNDIDKHLTK